MNVSLDVALVYMPFTELTAPSLSLSLFKGELLKRGMKAKLWYANIEYAQWLGKEIYMRLNASSHCYLTGEFIFRYAAFGGDKKTLAENYINWLTTSQEDVLRIVKPDAETFMNFVESMIRAQRIADEYLDELVKRVLEQKPKIIALSSMFQQNNAVIAFSKKIKKVAPEIIIMVGGCNCVDTAGAALLEYVPEFDYVFTAEADDTFPQLCEAIIKNEEISLPIGVLRQGDKGREGEYRLFNDLDSLVYPDYDDFVETLKEAGIDDYILYLEGSRGCWWGEKNPCAFCGLNRADSTYRQKSTTRLIEEIKYLHKKYGPRTISFSDNILSNKHMKELPKRAEEVPKGNVYFVEIKSNTKYEDLKNLVGIGFTMFQPGIESLSDHVLTLMNKGCRAIKQIEALKNYRRLKVIAAWNWLCGFPGETTEDYVEIVELIPKITHLTSPSGFFHIRYHKFSVYERNREKYGLDLVPSYAYKEVYPLGEDFIKRYAYIFDPADYEKYLIQNDCRRFPDPIYKKGVEKVLDWHVNKITEPDRLDATDYGDRIEIIDMRKAAKKLFYTLCDVKMEIYRLAEFTVKDSVLREKLNHFTKEEINEALAYLIEENLLLKIGEEYLSLAIPTE